MTVRELIKELEKIENKDRKVLVFDLDGEVTALDESELNSVVLI